METENLNENQPEPTSSSNDVSEGDIDAKVKKIYDKYQNPDDDAVYDDNGDGDGNADTDDDDEQQMADNSDENDDGADDQILLPKSWTQKNKELFDKADPELKKYLAEREAQIQEGFTRMDSHRQLGREYENILREYQNELSASGDPMGINTIKSLLPTAKIFNFGTPEEKINVLMDAAQRHGLMPLMQNMLMGQNGQQGQIDPVMMQVQQIAQQNAELTNYINQIRMKEEAAENHSVESEINQFMADKDKYPYSDMVIGDMVSLVERGIADSLTDAYDKACGLNADVRAKIIQSEVQKKFQLDLNKKQKIAENARTKSFSPSQAKSSSSINDVPQTEEEAFRVSKAIWDKYNR